MIRSEKLASIGRLAAGVAHEVGNPTGAILGYLDLLARGGLTEEEEKEIFKRAESEAERIRQIIRELLDFSRPSPGLEEQVDINGVIANALSLLSHQKKIWEQIQVVKELQEDLPPWPGDPHQLQQVMINLFLNAIGCSDCIYSPDGTRGKETTRVHLRFNQRWREQIFSRTSPGAEKRIPRQLIIHYYVLKEKFWVLDRRARSFPWSG